MMVRSWRMAVAAIVAALSLMACGGGGDSGAPSSNTVQPPATSIENILPSGARIDVSAKNLFPLALNDTWTYSSSSTGQPNRTVTHTVTAANGNNRTVNERVSTFGSSGASETSTTYLKSADGITEPAVDPTLPPGMLAIIGPLPLFVEPLYPANTTRILRRAGSTGSDLNGDGTAEGFRFEFSQTFQGFETLTFGRKKVEVAHFSSILTITITSSNPKDTAVTVIGTDESYFAAGFGLIKQVTETKDNAGKVLEPQTTLLLGTASVGGRSWTDYLAVEGELRTLNLPHKALVYDATRNVYYASIGTDATANANSVAVIDASSAKISFMALPGGSDPSGLAIAGDGNSLYVGLDGSSQVKRLGLPLFNDMGSVSLPVQSNFKTPTYAESIAASPTEPGTFAVSVASRNLSPKHDGVILVRNLVVQPKKTQTHTGSNIIVFDANGATLFGFNNETTEYGLRSIAVLADGLQETKVVGTNGGLQLGRVGQRLLIDRQVYSTADLSAAGVLSGAACHAGRSFILCQTQGSSQPLGAQQVVYYDPTTLSSRNSASYGPSKATFGTTRFVQGPVGQVAITTRDGQFPTQITLFDSEFLP